MRRIFSDYAYGAGPRAGCWWDDTARIDPNPPLGGDITCDVAIVGGGFTGISAALFLARSGVSVVVLEANAVGWGASGRNGGFCCLGGGMASDAALDRRHGRDARLDWRQAEKAAVDLVENVIDDLGVNVDRHSNGETCLTHRRRDFAGFAADAASVEENYGVTPTLTGRDDLEAAGMGGPFHGAMTTPVGFGLNPRKYLAGLVEAAKSAGARICDQTAVTNISGPTVQTTHGRVTATRVLLATNGYSSEDVPAWMAGRYMPAQSTVLVTRPLNKSQQADQGWTSDQMAFDSRRLLHYFRLLPDGRFLFGMRGGVLSGAGAEHAARAALTRDFRKMFPAWSQVEVTHSWSGMVCLARALVPFVGAVPGSPHLLAGFAYHGNGVAMGTFAGRLLADLALERAPALYPRIIKAPAQRFPLGRLRRAIMPAAYAAFKLGDHGS